MNRKSGEKVNGKNKAQHNFVESNELNVEITAVFVVIHTMGLFGLLLMEIKFYTLILSLVLYLLTMFSLGAGTDLIFT